MLNFLIKKRVKNQKIKISKLFKNIYHVALSSTFVYCNTSNLGSNHMIEERNNLAVVQKKQNSLGAFIETLYIKEKSESKIIAAPKFNELLLAFYTQYLPNIFIPQINMSQSSLKNCYLCKKAYANKLTISSKEDSVKLVCLYCYLYFNSTLDSPIFPINAFEHGNLSSFDEIKNDVRCSFHLNDVTLVDIVNTPQLEFELKYYGGEALREICQSYHSVINNELIKETVDKEEWYGLFNMPYWKQNFFCFLLVKALVLRFNAKLGYDTKAKNTVISKCIELFPNFWQKYYNKVLDSFLSQSNNNEHAKNVISSMINTNSSLLNAGNQQYVKNFINTATSLQYKLSIDFKQNYISELNIWIEISKNICLQNYTSTEELVESSFINFLSSEASKFAHYEELSCKESSSSDFNNLAALKKIYDQEISGKSTSKISGIMHKCSKCTSNSCREWTVQVEQNSEKKFLCIVCYFKDRENAEMVYDNVNILSIDSMFKANATYTIIKHISELNSHFKKSSKKLINLDVFIRDILLKHFSIDKIDNTINLKNLSNIFETHLIFNTPEMSKEEMIEQDFFANNVDSFFNKYSYDSLKFVPFFSNAINMVANKDSLDNTGKLALNFLNKQWTNIKTRPDEEIASVINLHIKSSMEGILEEDNSIVDSNQSFFEEDCKSENLWSKFLRIFKR